jgi:hypothetical protein
MFGSVSIDTDPEEIEEYEEEEEWALLMK